jgi:hypothetical protein
MNRKLRIRLFLNAVTFMAHFLKNGLQGQKERTQGHKETENLSYLDSCSIKKEG